MATDRTANQVPSLVLKSNAGNNADVFGWADPTTHRILVDAAVDGMGIPTYDYVAVTYPSGTQEVYTFKSGGVGGSTVATVTINYTDSTKASLLNVAKT